MSLDTITTEPTQSHLVGGQVGIPITMREVLPQENFQLAHCFLSTWMSLVLLQAGCFLLISYFLGVSLIIQEFSEWALFAVYSKPIAREDFTSAKILTCLSQVIAEAVSGAPRMTSHRKMAPLGTKLCLDQSVVGVDESGWPSEGCIRERRMNGFHIFPR